MLSDGEALAVRLLLSGSRVPLSARQLHLSPSTIRNQLSMAYRKLGVSSQQELILLFHALWHDGRTPAALLEAEVLLRQPRTLCAACRTPLVALTTGAITTTAVGARFPCHRGESHHRRASDSQKHNESVMILTEGGRVDLARKRLWDVAVDQYGYVTLRDAADLAIDGYAVRMLAARGQLERVAHGVYRFPQFPAGEYDPYMLAVLWTGAAGACLSHDTALASYEVCDINPDRIHLTLPEGRRIRRRGGELYVVHHEDLAPEQIGWWQQIPTVTLATAIAQCIRSGVPGYLVRQALATARDRGALTQATLDDLSQELEARDGG